jgi:hypothetical protein
MSETIGIWISALLTVMVFSYLLGDNPLFRLAVHLFIGTTIGYAVLVAYYSVLWPKLIQPLLHDPLGNWLLFVPLVLSLLLLARLNRRLGRLGIIPLAVLLGVGAALAIGGALSGSILPQAGQTIMALSPSSQGWGAVVSNLVLILGVLSVLFYFYFTAESGTGLGRIKLGFLKAWGGLGKWFIMATFGAIFASTVTSRISLLIGRLQFLIVELPKTFK